MSERERERLRARARCIHKGNKELSGHPFPARRYDHDCLEPIGESSSLLDYRQSNRLIDRISPGSLMTFASSANNKRIRPSCGSQVVAKRMPHTSSRRPLLGLDVLMMLKLAIHVGNLCLRELI